MPWDEVCPISWGIWDPAIYIKSHPSHAAPNIGGVSDRETIPDSVGARLEFALHGLDSAGASSSSQTPFSLQSEVAVVQSRLSDALQFCNRAPSGEGAPEPCPVKTFRSERNPGSYIAAREHTNAQMKAIMAKEKSSAAWRAARPKNVVPRPKNVAEKRPSPKSVPRPKAPPKATPTVKVIEQDSPCSDAPEPDPTRKRKVPAMLGSGCTPAVYVGGTLGSDRPPVGAPKKRPGPAVAMEPLVVQLVTAGWRNLHKLKEDDGAVRGAERAPVWKHCPHPAEMAAQLRRVVCPEALQACQLMCCVIVYIYIYIDMYIRRLPYGVRFGPPSYIYIYIYRERERERERDTPPGILYRG